MNNRATLVQGLKNRHKRQSVYVRDDMYKLVVGPCWVAQDGDYNARAPQLRFMLNGEVLGDDFTSYGQAVQWCKAYTGSDWTIVDLVNTCLTKEAKRCTCCSG